MEPGGKTREELQQEIDRLRALLNEQEHELARVRRRQDQALPSEAQGVSREQVLHALQESETRFRHLADAAPVLIWMTDAEGRATYFNERWRTFTGRLFEEEWGAGWLQSVHPDDRGSVEARYRRAHQSREPFRMEYRLRDRSGAYRWLLDSGMPRFMTRGEYIGHIGSRVDITDRKRRELRLVSARDQAEALARVKSAFLTNMTHEIRTPLTVILGFTSMLRQGVYDEYQRFVHVIERSGQRLLRMLDSLLDLAHLEAGTLQASQDPIMVSDVVRSAAEAMRPLAEEKGLTFRIALAETGLRAQLDYEVLARVLHNLIDNAIKFTDHGEIILEAESDEHWVYLRICDTGIGIDEAFFPYLFKEFVQESTGLARSHQGSGLGLAVSKRLVELMGGSIHAESAKGKGSVFTICLPRAAPAQVQAKAAS